MRATAPRLARLPPVGSDPTWQQATEAFLRRDLSPKTRPI